MSTDRFHPDPHRSRLVQLSGWIAFGLSLALGWRLVAPGDQQLLDPRAEPLPIGVRAPLDAEERSTIELFEHSKASVVHIRTSELVPSRRGFFTIDTVEVPRGSGSGFLWGTDGYVVTNFHVLLGAAKAFVMLADGTQHEGELVGVDADHDIAVLRIAAPRGLTASLPLGTSSDLRVGQKVFAIGNPFGLDWTLTSGIISGLDRTIQSVAETRIRGVIQTDAAINPGNSGGPLLDSAGRLIGVNTAILSPSGSSAGIGFAVPVDTINRIVPQIIRSGRPERAALGVRLVSDSIVRRAGIEGAVIEEVLPGSAAERAGLRSLREGPRGPSMDVIVAIGGNPVRNLTDLLEEMGEHDIGEEVTVTVERDGRRSEHRVVLQERD